MIAVARVTKLFGADGGLEIRLYDAFPRDFTMEEPLHARIDGLAVPLFFDAFAFSGAAGARVRVADFASDRRAEQLIGLELFADGPEEDEFELDELIGFTALVLENKKWRPLGTLSAFFDNDVNPLFEINGKTLIPAAEEFIAGIDFRKRTIKLVLPEGLLDL